MPELEPPDELTARIDDAARYVPLDQLCAQPAVRVRHTIHGNVITEEEQWAKLRHVVEIADRVWG